MRCNYQNWSMNSTEPNAWQAGDLSLAASQNEFSGGIELYLTREDKKLNTFLIELDKEEAIALRDKLNELLPEDKEEEQ